LIQVHCPSKKITSWAQIHEPLLGIFGWNFVDDVSWGSSN
jgi:hypothetical protein